MKQEIIIAIDGYSSSGKSTLAKALAKELNYKYIDTGAMYRAVTLHALRKKWIRSSDNKIDKNELINGLNDIEIQFIRKDSTQHTILNGEDVEKEIRNLAVSNAVSYISQIKEVREKMVKIQQKIGKNKGIVMDGRDIGTVVFPDAEIKIFMTADVESRAKRRFEELKARGIPVDKEEISKNIKERDKIDENRKESPLKKAKDAIVLDNSYMNQEEQFHWAMKKINNYLNN